MIVYDIVLQFSDQPAGIKVAFLIPEASDTSLGVSHEGQGDNLSTKGVRTKCGKVTSWAENRGSMSSLTLRETKMDRLGHEAERWKIKKVFSSNLSDYMQGNKNAFYQRR